MGDKKHIRRVANAKNIGMKVNFVGKKEPTTNFEVTLNIKLQSNQVSFSVKDRDTADLLCQKLRNIVGSFDWNMSRVLKEAEAKRIR